MTPKEFLDQYELQDFINGVGLFKWQSDQMTLNYWFKKNKVSVQRMDWKWNCLYTTVSNGNLKDSHFVHFFLRDKLPSSGENVDELRIYEYIVTGDYNCSLENSEEGLFLWGPLFFQDNQWWGFIEYEEDYWEQSGKPDVLIRSFTKRVSLGASLYD